MINKEEIALELTKIINENRSLYTDEYLNEKGVINTYKRVLEEIKDDK